MSIPSGRSTVCFDRDRFLDENFSVDAFLHEHRNVASPETMRDDLGLYLKVLRSAMIDLINKDYADFVNLSANLIGLHEQIDKIQSPLIHFKREVSKIDVRLSEAMKELAGRLEQKKTLRERKKRLEYSGRTRASLRKLESILNVELDRETVERASLEYDRLRFAIVKCEPLISAEQRERAERIGNIIETSLSDMLLESLEKKDAEATHACLRIFSMLDRTSTVAALIRKNLVAPAMRTIIDERSLQRNPRGLEGVYADILRFLDDNFKHIVAPGKFDRSVKNHAILLDGFWTEVEYLLEVRLSSIFAPGNPELFFARYNDSVHFLERIERYFADPDALAQFRRHPQYKSFQQKWNLPIYFQIRFQEIAGAFESVLSETANVEKSPMENPTSEEYRLNVTSSCWSALTACWGRGVFIEALTHRFFKLTLQIISRFCTWIDAAIEQPRTNRNPSENLGREKSFSETTKFFIYLYSDMKKLIDNLTNLSEIIKTRLGSSFSRFDILERCLADSKTSLESRLPRIQKNIVTRTSAESIAHLKQLTDIPRLFRKTNRDVPVKPCNYVDALVKSPRDLYDRYRDVVGDEEMSAWLEDAFSIITARYYIAVNDVITSVQKTEDSLRRLKQIRDRPSRPVASVTDRIGVTDDDKIRIQLKVDVAAYRSLLDETRVRFDRVDKLNDLIVLTDRAADAKHDDR